MENRKAFIGKSIIIFVITIILLTFFSSTINNFSLPRVLVDITSSGALLKDTTGQGNVQPKGTDEYSIQSNMKVLDLYVQVGTKVVKGQDIAALDVQDLQKTLQQENANLEQKQIMLEKLLDTNIAKLNADKTIKLAKDIKEQMQKKYENTKQLYEGGTATEDQLSIANRGLVNANSDYNIALESKAKMLRDNERDLKNFQSDIDTQKRKIQDINLQISTNGLIKAPGNGTINELNFIKGSMANSSKPIYKMSYSESGFELRLMVDSLNIGYLKAGDDINVTLVSLSNKVVKGKLVQISDNIQSADKKDLLINLNDPDLKGGEAAEIDVVKKTKSYNILVPNDAINSDDNGKFICTIKEAKGPLGKEQRLQKVSVQVEDSDLSKTAITANLIKGEKIVISSNKPISEGSNVIVTQ